ncbi:hypothetical protein [Desulfovibrio inopinatus]|uniref:hypothetical protein n=1 Tax=Desulfovibrio inopinatus TaxID=102109 RepID=UPI00042361F5|nr:hypothetical protein [Desulfovibrio inopinatus]
MEGLNKALEYVSGLKDQIYSRSEVEIDGRKYSRSPLHSVFEPNFPTLYLTTLTGLKDYIAEDVDGLNPTISAILRISGPTRVELLSPPFGAFKQREVFAEANPLLPGFPFDAFMDHEQFVIGLHSMFVESNDRDELLKAVAAIKIDSGASVVDDGLSQKVTVESGARLVDRRELKPRVTLRPYCTFQEIEQPERQFLFRLNKDGEPGLFVADGEAWRNKVMADIKQWLKEALPGMKVIA